MTKTTLEEIEKMEPPFWINYESNMEQGGSPFKITAIHNTIMINLRVSYYKDGILNVDTSIGELTPWYLLSEAEAKLQMLKQ